MKHYLLVLMSLVLLSACTTTEKHSNQEDSIVGNWAMEPLNNGVANVAVFNKDGTNALHIFVCDWTDDQSWLEDNGQIEKGQYTFDEASKELSIISGSRELVLIVQQLDRDTLVATERPAKDSLFPGFTYKYRRSRTIEPNCDREQL